MLVKGVPVGECFRGSYVLKIQGQPETNIEHLQYPFIMFMCWFAKY